MNTQNLIVKESITESLFYLMKEKDFKDISIKEITTKAGVGRVSFYRNYNSKEDIIKSFLDVNFKKWSDKWVTNNDITYLIFSYFYSEKEIIKILINSRLESLLLEHIIHTCEYDSNDDNAKAYAKSMFAYGLFGWCMEWYKRGMQETPETMTNLIKQMKDK